MAGRVVHCPTRSTPRKASRMPLELTDPRPIERAEEILTAEALAFLEKLHQHFAARRDELLAARTGKRKRAASAGRWTSCPRPRRSGPATGRWLRRRRRCRTAGSR